MTKLTMTNPQAELLELALAADDSFFNDPVHFAGQGCAGTIDSAEWYRLLGLAGDVPGFDATPYRLDRRSVTLSADEARRLAQAVEIGAKSRGIEPNAFQTYLQPLRAGAVTLFPAGLDFDSPLAAIAPSENH